MVTGWAVRRAQNVQFWIMLQAWRTSCGYVRMFVQPAGVLRPGN